MCAWWCIRDKSKEANLPTKPVHYHEGGFPPKKIDWERLIPLLGRNIFCGPFYLNYGPQTASRSVRGPQKIKSFDWPKAGRWTRWPKMGVICLGFYTFWQQKERSNKAFTNDPAFGDKSILMTREERLSNLDLCNATFFAFAVFSKSISALIVISS